MQAWVDKVTALVDRIGADAKGKEVGLLNHHVGQVTEAITGRFRTCQGHWRQIGVRLESLYLELNSAAQK